MSVLITTPKAVDANAYASVARIDVILGQRLHADAWDDAGTTPDAEGYQTSASALVGANSVAIDTGTGTFTANCKFTFAGHATVYKSAGALSEAGTLEFTPALTAAVADDEVINRITPNEKEAAAIWATMLEDNLMTWFGTKRTDEQRLRFPRSGIVDPDGFFYDYDNYPEILEIATAELALVLVEDDTFKAPDSLGLGVSEVQLGPLSAKIDSKEQQAVIPDSILALLDPLGFLESAAQTGTKIVPLKRA